MEGMLISLLIILPLLAGLILISLKNNKNIGFAGTILSIILLGLTLFLICGNSENSVQYDWFKIGQTEAKIALSLTGLGATMVLLSTLVYSFLFLYLNLTKEKYSNTFHGLLFIAFGGLNGVFLAQDLVLFYFFWEIVLIPIYFLIGIWGSGKSRITANTTFFLYTILGSMLMLGGILFIGFQLKPASFLLEDVIKTTSEFTNMRTLAWLFFIAFAIKIPLFPLHSWQPNVYKTSPTPVTVILSTLMAKMGLFAVVNWLLNLFPQINPDFDVVLYIVGFGLVYASLIALTTNNLKKIVAYSSIAHLALIFMSLYSQTQTGNLGAYFQMFSHGIVVLGMWLSVDYLERNYKIKDIRSIGGIASVDPAFAVFFTFLCLANVALPLTSSFIGEFMMLSSLFSYNIILCVLGCMGVILSAAYTLRMMTAILFGEKRKINVIEKPFHFSFYLIFGMISVLILVLGIYPSILLNLFS